jgi:hypothetical protein
MSRDPKEFLPKFVGKEDSILGPRATTKQPWALDLDGVLHTFATDGKRLVLMRGDFGFDPCPAEARGGVHRVLSDIGFNPSTRIDVRELARFVKAIDEPPCGPCMSRRQFACPECSGTGETPCTCPTCGHDHEGRCSVCSGDRIIWCGHCREGWDLFVPVKLGRAWYDLKIFNHALQLLPDVAAGDFSTGMERRELGWPGTAILTTEEWLLMVSPLRYPDVRDADKRKRFDESPVFAPIAPTVGAGGAT